MSATWVLLRGLTREAAHWGPLPLHLQRALPGARLLLPDLPGAGALHRQPSPLRIAAITEACRSQVQAQAGRGPVHLLGLSMGGMVAADWLTRHPGEVAAAVLVNSSTRRLSPLHRRLQPAAWRTAPQLLAGWGGPAAEARVLALSSRRHAADAALREHWAALQRQRPVSRLNALRQLWAAAAYQLPDGPPPCPVLVLSSAADALVHPGCSAAIARHWGAPLRQHPLAGHDLALDDPAWLAGSIATWLAAMAPDQKR